MRSVRTAASTSNRIRRSRTAGTRSCASWSEPSGGVSGGTRSPRTNSRARGGNPGVPAFGTSLTAKAGPAVLHRLRRRRQASPARNPVSIRTCGAQILESPIEPGQGTGANLTGSYPSGDSTQVDRESSCRGGVRRHPVGCSTCSRARPDHGALQLRSFEPCCSMVRWYFENRMSAFEASLRGAVKSLTTLIVTVERLARAPFVPDVPRWSRAGGRAS